jgi:RNA polymerase sigma factor (sigma-70 family)
MESYDDLQTLIRALPEQYREVLMLRYAVGLKPKQISILLGRKVTTVQQQITRGKQLLSSALRQREVQRYA